MIWFIFSSENLHALNFNTHEQWIPCRAVLDVDVKSATPCDGNNILLPLSFLWFFSSRVQKGLLSRVKSVSGSSIVNVDKIVTIVLSNKISIFQRKQSSRFWILEMQNNNTK